MCGIICGNTNPLFKINDALLSLAKRGPDGDGLYISDTVFLGHTLLSIFSDDSTNATQPILSNDKSIIGCVNGEIFNHHELTKLLEDKGYKFNTTSDSEILIHGYHYLKEKFFSLIDGEYCFVLYDYYNETWICGVDDYGTKPLRYYLNDTFIVSSTVDAIMKLGINVSMSYDNVMFNILSQCMPIGKTLYNNIYAIPPGHYIEVNGSLEVTVKKHKKENDLIERLDIDLIEYNIEQSIIKKTMGVKNLALPLSSGIDSSMIAYYLNKNRINFKSYSIDFVNVEYSETDDVRNFVNNHSIDNEIVTISEMDIINNFKQSVLNAETFSINSHCAAKYILNLYMKSVGHTVCLTGDGADELFYGYMHFHQSRLKFLYNSLRTGMQILPLVNDDYSEMYHDTVKKIYAEFDGNDDKTLYMTYWLNEYGLKVLGDSQSANVSQEHRYPFLDNNIEKSLNVHNIKDLNYPSKNILRQIVKKWDSDLYNIPKKPFRSYDIDQNWIPLLEYYVIEVFRQHNIFNHKLLVNYVDTVKHGGWNSKIILNQLLCFGILLEKFDLG